MLHPIDLKIERRINASLGTVWACVTQPDFIAEWFFAVDFQPVVGHRFVIRGAPVLGWRGWTNVEIIELEPLRRMVWSFDCVEEAPPSRVCFELDEVAGGVRLLLTHEGKVPQNTRLLLDQGWSAYTRQLTALAERMQGAAG